MTSYPLLIGGCPRSGTTAILQTINSSPNAYISSEENILKGAQSLGSLLGTRSRREKTLAKGMRDLSVRETLTLDNIHSHNFSDDAVWPTLQFIYEYHHRKLNGATPLLLWGDKLPGYVHELDTILSNSKIRYLHITRNPFDVVNSMLRRLTAAREGRDWWKSITDFETMVGEWAKAYAAARSVESCSQVYHFHYEELIFDFDHTMKKINQFLNIELQYKNMLVADRALHYDRSYLTQEMVDNIASHPMVREYMKNCRNMPELKNVEAAIDGLI